MKSILATLTLLLCFAAAAEEAPLEPPYTSGSRATSLKPVPKPTRVNDEGDYLYGDTPAKDAIYYKRQPTPAITGAAFIRFGTIGPFAITSDTGKTFKQIYSEKSSFVAGFEYEKQLGHLLGKWSWKLGTGITTEDGNGTFANPANTALPEEKFMFIVMPNTASLNYKLRFSDTQWVIPYVEGGAGYFTFIEYRDDGNRTAYGGAGVLTGAAGLLLSITSIDQVAAGTMYEDYGIKHLWLDLQFKRIAGLDKQKDFTSNMITGGFGFAF